MAETKKEIRVGPQLRPDLERDRRMLPHFATILEYPSLDSKPFYYREEHYIDPATEIDHIVWQLAATANLVLSTISCHADTWTNTGRCTFNMLVNGDKLHGRYDMVGTMSDSTRHGEKLSLLMFPGDVFQLGVTVIYWKSLDATSGLFKIQTVAKGWYL